MRLTGRKPTSAPLPTWHWCAFGSAGSSARDNHRPVRAGLAPLAQGESHSFIALLGDRHHWREAIHNEIRKDGP